MMTSYYLLPAYLLTIIKYLDKDKYKIFGFYLNNHYNNNKLYCAWRIYTSLKKQFIFTIITIITIK